MNRKTELLPGTPIKIAVLAMGGQGGGVLADWIVDMAEHAGWWAQTTSVPGVAQRTGATIYYLELLPEADAEAAGKPPTLAMMPTPGDVDLVVAAELMEAGRAMQRGLVTPDRSTLITSTHRSYSVTEKAALGNGIGDGNSVLDAGRNAARRLIALDLQVLAEQAGSVISASLFGAIAGSGALPFGREAFENTIRSAGKGVEASLRAFALGFNAAASAPAVPAPIETPRPTLDVPERAAQPQVQALLDRLKVEFPAATHGILVAGLRRLLDYQDLAYAKEYLARCHTLCALDERYGGAAKDWALAQAAAHRLAVAMSYDDVIRVADLKTRGSRFERVAREVGLKGGQVLQTTEFTHPRLEEICGTLPAGIGRRLERSTWFAAWVKRRFAHGKRISSSTFGGFFSLYAVAGMRRFRRRTLRHQVESAQIARWLKRVEKVMAQDYGLAVEIVHCRQLVKGYSGTHERGGERFETLMNAADTLCGRHDAARTLADLRTAALADEEGKQLGQALARALGTVAGSAASATASEASAPRLAGVTRHTAAVAQAR
ncbi:indolepyruvate oxidoreductase subunit beta family protein [Nitrogeniibacter aestuarii]|uniref:indolepyruvate oxidoreductase subunit beta family protein n=1 Tax=Nitrogeniibacter aestuarii TaxID=2815343 RepID=UPI001E5AEBB6|nr:indolepyruvate oxidoreductase subunit beta family protein [Nitrogeniibacter aestuarii]